MFFYETLEFFVKKFFLSGDLAASRYRVPEKKWISRRTILARWEHVPPFLNGFNEKQFFFKRERVSCMKNCFQGKIIASRKRVTFFNDQILLTVNSALGL